MSMPPQVGDLKLAAQSPAAAEPVRSVLDNDPPLNILLEITCPHCWHRFPTEQILFVSQHAELLGDPVLGPEAQLRFRSSRFTMSGDAIDAREAPCQQLACPRCHLTIPRAVLETAPLFISIVGAPGSGKSHFLAAMAWELRRLMPAKFGVSFNDADALSNHTLHTYEETLFLQTDTGRLVAIRKTELDGDGYDQVQLGQQFISLPRPFLFTIRPAAIESKVRLLCLYDNAGEHFQPGMDSFAAPATQHLAHSRAIFFLYDPTQHPRFRDACKTVSNDPQLTTVARNLRQEVLLNEAAARVRRYAGLSPKEKHKWPLVVIVSKADIWASLAGIELNQEPFTSGSPAAVCIDQIERASSILRKMLLKWTPEFITAADEFCSQVVYVPASALGHAPEFEAGSGILGVRPRDIAPRWVTAPLLYTFAKWTKGLISANITTPAAS